MNKKIARISLISILIFGIIYFGVYFIQNNAMKKNHFEVFGYNKIDSKLISQDFVRCNLNVFEPEFAYLVGKTRGMINFYQPKNLFSQTKEEWESSYIGGTDIKNTTFPQLLKMVKEDCSQFQEKHYESDEKIRWSYSKAETKEEKEKRDKRNKKEDEEFKEKWNKMTDEEKKEFVEERSTSREDFGFIEYNEDGTIKEQ